VKNSKALYSGGVFQAAKIGKVFNKTKDKRKKIKEKVNSYLRYPIGGGF